MDLLTTNQAAKATGRNITTIRRAASNGKISGIRREADNAWLVAPADLFKVYPPRQEHKASDTDEVRRDRDAWRDHANALLNCLVLAEATMIQRPTD